MNEAIVETIISSNPSSPSFPVPHQLHPHRNTHLEHTHTLSLSQPKSLPPALGVQVQVRRLAQGAHAVAGPRLGVVVGRAVPHAPVVPDSQVVLAPLEADLGVVILRDHVEEVAEEDVRLVFGDAVDALGEALVDVDGFPARDSWWELMLALYIHTQPRFTLENLYHSNKATVSWKQSSPRERKKKEKKKNLRFVRITGCTAIKASP